MIMDTYITYTTTGYITGTTSFTQNSNNDISRYKNSNPNLNFLLYNGNISTLILQQQYYIKNDNLIKKDLLAFTINKSIFIANDIDSCVITAQNLIEPVNILIDRQPYIISPIDNIITITSNEPKIFLIEPDPQSIYYFDKIEIEAI